jgi:hypothetical protein
MHTVSRRKNGPPLRTSSTAAAVRAASKGRDVAARHKGGGECVFMLSLTRIKKKSKAIPVTGRGGL